MALEPTAESYGSRTQVPEQGGGLGDAWSAIKATGLGAAAGASGLIADADPNWEYAWRQRQRLLDTAKETVLNDISPKNKAALQASWFPGPGQQSAWEMPARTIGMQLASMSPYLVAGALTPQSIPAQAAGAVGWGVQGMSEERGDLRRSIETKPDADLQTASAPYRQMRAMGMTEGAAKERLIESARTGTEDVRALLTGTLAGAGFYGAGKGARGVLPRIGLGAAEVGPAEALQSGASAYAEQLGEVRTGQRPTVDTGEVWRQAGHAGVMGGGLGGVLGALHRPRVTADLPPDIRAGAGGGAGVPAPPPGAANRIDPLAEWLARFRAPDPTAGAPIPPTGAIPPFDPMAAWQSRFGGANAGAAGAGTGAPAGGGPSPYVPTAGVLSQVNRGLPALTGQYSPWGQGLNFGLQTPGVIEMGGPGQPRLEGTPAPLWQPEALPGAQSDVGLLPAPGPVETGEGTTIAMGGAGLTPEQQRAAAAARRANRAHGLVDHLGGNYTVFPDGTTKRDNGPRSQMTVYVHEGAADRISQWSLANGDADPQITPFGGRLFMTTSRGPGDISFLPTDDINTRFATEPQNGLVPVELHADGERGYTASLVGGKVVNIKRGRRDPKVRMQTPLPTDAEVLEGTLGATNPFTATEAQLRYALANAPAATPRPRASAEAGRYSAADRRLRANRKGLQLPADQGQWWFRTQVVGPEITDVRFLPPRPFRGPVTHYPAQTPVTHDLPLVQHFTAQGEELDWPGMPAGPVRRPSGHAVKVGVDPSPEYPTGRAIGTGELTRAERQRGRATADRSRRTGQAGDEQEREWGLYPRSNFEVLLGNAKDAREGVISTRPIGYQPPPEQVVGPSEPWPLRPGQAKPKTEADAAELARRKAEPDTPRKPAVFHIEPENLSPYEKEQFKKRLKAGEAREEERRRSTKHATDEEIARREVQNARRRKEPALTADMTAAKPTRSEGKLIAPSAEVAAIRTAILNSINKLLKGSKLDPKRLGEVKGRATKEQMAARRAAEAAGQTPQTADEVSPNLAVFRAMRKLRDDLARIPEIGTQTDYNGTLVTATIKTVRQAEINAWSTYTYRIQKLEQVVRAQRAEVAEKAREARALARDEAAAGKPAPIKGEGLSGGMRQVVERQVKFWADQLHQAIQRNAPDAIKRKAEAGYNKWNAILRGEGAGEGGEFAVAPKPAAKAKPAAEAAPPGVQPAAVDTRTRAELTAERDQLRHVLTHPKELKAEAEAKGVSMAEHRKLLQADLKAVNERLAAMPEDKPKVRRKAGSQRVPPAETIVTEPPPQQTTAPAELGPIDPERVKRAKALMTSEDSMMASILEAGTKGDYENFRKLIDKYDPPVHGMSARVPDLVIDTTFEEVRHGKYAGMKNVPNLETRYGKPDDPPKRATVKQELTHLLREMMDRAVTGREKAAARFLNHLYRRLEPFIGDTPIHFLSNADFHKITAGRPMLGVFYEGVFYDAGTARGTIWIKRSVAYGEDGPHVLLHEIAHAATAAGLKHGSIRMTEARHKELAAIRAELQLMGTEMHALLRDNPELMVRYGFSDVQAAQVKNYRDVLEFVAEAFSNPSLQRLMLERPAPPGVRKGNSNERTWWQSFLSKLRSLFGLSKVEGNMLDAVLRLTEEIIPVSRSYGTGSLKLTEARVLSQGLPANPHPLSAPDVVRRVEEARAALPHQLAGSKHWLRTNATKLMSTEGIKRAARAYYERDDVGRTVVDTMVNAYARMNAEVSATVRQHVEPVDTEARKMQRKYLASGMWEKYQNMSQDATMWQVFPHLSLADQPHFATKRMRDASGAVMRDAAGRPRTVPDLDAAVNWQARAKHEELATTWRDLPPDLKDFDLNVKRPFLERMHDEATSLLAYNNVDTLLPDMPEAAKRSLAQRIVSGTATDAELDAHGDAAKLLKTLRDHPALKKLAVYSPLYRDGDYVVHGKYRIATPGGAVKVDAHGTPDPDGNTWRFDTRDGARAFVHSLPVKALQVTNVYVDAAGSRYKPDSKRYTKRDADAGRATLKVEVAVQDKHVEFFRDFATAHRRHAELKAAPPEGLELYAPEQKRWSMPEVSRSFMSREWRSAMDRMEKNTRFQSKPEAVKTFMRNMMIEQSLMALGPTRVQSSRLPRGYVSGASPELVQNLGRYGLNYAGYNSRLRHMPLIDKTMKAVNEQANDRTGHPDGVMARQTIRDELERRIYDPREPIKNSLWYNIGSRILQMSFLDKLASPAFHIINSSEPWTIAVPVLAGRHGLGASSAEMTAAYRAIGGGFDTWGRGAVDTARAFRDSAKMTDYSMRLKDRLATQPDGAELADLYGEVEGLGLVGQDAGMELQHRMERSEWLLGRGLDRMDHMARQMGTAVESVNRYVVGTTAYRLEKRRALKEGKSEAQARTIAKQYAIDTLYSTMGDYSAWNSPPLFNSPVGRMALQFKKYGQKIYQLLAMTAGQMRHSGEWNPEAIKAFGGVIATHALLAGTLGLPLEPIKAAAIIAGLLGGDMEYADIERRWREFLVDHLGADIGEIMARGVPRWAGVDMQRVGLDSLLLPMGEPKSSKAADIGQYVMQIAMGAPMSMVFEYPEAVEKLMKGDIMGGAAQLVPFKGAADALLAMQRLDQGKLTPGKKTAMDPYTPGEAFTRFLGFTPEREAETNDMRSFIQHEKAKRTKTRREEIAEYVTAQTADEREAVWERIQDNNDSLPPVARLTLPMLAAAAERRRHERATGREQFGITIGPQERDLLTQAQRYYNVR